MVMSHQVRNTNLNKFRRLIDAGEYFEAHEVMEAVWIANGRVRGDLWQGLTQLAVALTHADRGNLAGAGRLYARARANLDDAVRGDPLVQEITDFACRRYATLQPEEE